MENDLTFSVLYTPNIETCTVNPLCSDSKIHIRFRDYNKPQVIRGFEKKLTYLMTCLVNYSWINNLFDICDANSILNTFSNDNEVQAVKALIEARLMIQIKGFKFKTNYKKSTCNAFGNLNQEVFPLNYDPFGNPTTCDLHTFLSNLSISLETFLFDDSYAIVIHKKFTKDVNQKFINKDIKRTNRKTDFVELW